MTVLYVAHKPPVPNVDGGTFAMKQFADVLTSVTKADAFILSTHKHPFTSATGEYLKSRFQSFAYEHIDTEIKTLSFLLSLFSGSSYILQRFKSQKLKVQLEKKQYDLIVCDSLFSLYAVLEAKPEIESKLWLRSHNVEFLNWITLSRQQGAVKRLLYKTQAKRLKKKELELIKKVDINFCISNEDEKTFNSLLPDKKTQLLPITVESNEVPVSDQPECFFLGSENWGPNIDSVNYLHECWKIPEFQKHKLNIAGGFNELFPEHIPKGIQLIGRVENVSEFMAQNGILVAPSFSGSGIKVKVLEAMGNGIPVITTDFGAQGISEESGLIIVSDKKEMLAAIERLKTNREYFLELSSQGKNYIQKKHSFASVEAILKEAFGG
jgi:polysaccharide biosynthesis protein PslH